MARRKRPATSATSASYDGAALRRAVEEILDYVRDMDEAREDWTEVCQDHPLLLDGAPIRGLDEASWRIARLADGLGLVVARAETQDEPVALVYQQDGAWRAEVRLPDERALTLQPTPP